MASEATIAAMKQIGKEWTKGDRHRIYFDDLPSLYGLSLHFWKTGNVASAQLNGERISNAAGRGMLYRLQGKLFYDFADGNYHTSGIEVAEAKVLFAAIKEKVAAIERGEMRTESGPEEEA